MLIFQKQGEGITGEQVHELLNELDTNRNGQVELDEYLQVRPENVVLFLFMTALFSKSVAFMKMHYFFFDRILTKYYN